MGKYSPRLLWVLGLGILPVLLGDIRKETPVGLILTPGESSIIPAQSETPLTAKAGVVLFAGDVLRTRSGGAKFLFCPSQSSDELAPASEAVFSATQVNVKTGKIANQSKINSCFLPTVARVTNASQQHYGATIVRGLNPGAEAQPVPKDKLDAATVAELAPFDALLAANANDPGALIGRAAVFEKHNLLINAAAEYRKAAAALPDAVWIKGKIFELEEASATASATSAATAAGGATYAVLIGISKYQKLPQDLWLQYAHADANTFDKYLQSPRGGVPAGNITLLTDEKATTAAIRNAFQTALKARANKDDSVIIAIAAHGIVETTAKKGAFIVTYDTDPQDLAATGLPFSEVQDLVENELSKVGRVTLFVDVCRAGSIGSLHNTAVNAAVAKVGESEAKIFGFTAGRPSELSREGAEFGGGHGAFSFYVLKSFAGDADSNQDGMVSVNEVIEYVQDGVKKATGGKQHPREFGGLAGEAMIADLRKPGVPVAQWPMLQDPRGGPLQLANAAPQAPLAGDVSRDVAVFDEALREGRVLPDSPRSAFAALRVLRGELPPEQYLMKENQLRVALEDRGQQVLLRYLEGDQIPQHQDDFLNGAHYFEAAAQLTPESLYLDSRATFCRGRAKIFDKDYTGAADLLERSVQIDPGGAYAYNALGVAYLERADYARAFPALRDAARRAPQWTYPLHNLALASIQTGDYDAAIRYYRQAIQLTPQFSYLQYNLGLVYQRLNRRKEAEAAYRKAIGLSPGLAAPYNALASIRAAAGKFNEAETLYRQALDKDPNLLTARHNLALLLASRPARQAEAITLWRANLAKSPEFVPSRLSLAETLADAGDAAAAIAEYRKVMELKPDYIGARLALAGLLLKSQGADEAVRELEEARKRDPRNGDILERIGDIEAGRRRFDEAIKSYDAAIALVEDKSTKKRLKGKLANARKGGR